MEKNETRDVAKDDRPVDDAQLEGVAGGTGGYECPRCGGYKFKALKGGKYVCLGCRFVIGG